MIKQINKKGQEEITGFVLIVVLVAIVLVVFLGIALRSNKTTTLESRDIDQFLESAMQYTTECALNYETDYVKMSGLIRECYDNPEKDCQSGKKACDVLNETIGGMLRASWPTGKDRPLKGLIFESNYEQNTSSGMIVRKIIIASSGNCSQTIKGSEYVSANLPGNIVSSLKLCS